jgi:hypothetical protein
MTQSSPPGPDQPERPDPRQEAPAGTAPPPAAAVPAAVGIPRVVPTARLAAAAGELAAAIEARVLGQHEAVTVLLAAYVAGGHALIEGLPGLGKTRLARTFSQCLGARFSRVQFTPDLMPADLVGTNVFDAGAGFRLLRGPVFTDVLMADEINRTPPKTQSALLEAMQEGQVTIDGETHPLGAGFFVVATQNPIELEGVYPLPEAQLDRFLVRIEMGLPSRAAELELLRQSVASSTRRWAPRCWRRGRQRRCASAPAACTSPRSCSTTSRAWRRRRADPPTSSWGSARAPCWRCSQRRGRRR